MTKYAKKGLIHTVIVGADGTETLYKARKLAARSLASEGMKLLTVVTPSLGAGADALIAKKKRESNYEEGQDHTFGAMLQLLSENIQNEHFMDLSDALMGSLMVGDEIVPDIDDYFDDHIEDYLPVLLWLVKENFTNFILGNAIAVSLIKRWMSLVSPEMKESIEKMRNDLLGPEESGKTE